MYIHYSFPHKYIEATAFLRSQWNILNVIMNAASSELDTLSKANTTMQVTRHEINSEAVTVGYPLIGAYILVDLHSDIIAFGFSLISDTRTFDLHIYLRRLVFAPLIRRPLSSQKLQINLEQNRLDFITDTIRLRRMS